MSNGAGNAVPESARTLDYASLSVKATGPSAVSRIKKMRDRHKRCRSGQPQALAGQPCAAGEHLVEGEPRGVDQDRIGGRAQWSERPLGVVAVAAALVFEDLVDAGGDALPRHLCVASLGPRLVARGEEELYRRLGEDDGADVPSLEDGAARRPSAQPALQAEEPLPHHR